MISDGDLKKAVKILKTGGIVIFPTDTVYGIGCRVDNPKACRRISRIKGTPQNQPFPILVSGIDQVEKMAKITKLARKLIQKYWPGGLTIILRSRAGNQKLGFRMPGSSLIRKIIDQVGEPIIGTSANFHGQETSTSFGELDPKLVKLADYVIGGKCQKGIASTVVDLTTKPPKILRKGAILLQLFK